MALEVKDFDSPGETRHGQVVGHGVFEPGWRWSEHVKPIAGK